MRHWNLTRDAHGIAWMRLDTAGASMNKLSAEAVSYTHLTLPTNREV